MFQAPVQVECDFKTARGVSCRTECASSEGSVKRMPSAEDTSNCRNC
jgi:hypothetical protein